MVSFLIRTSPDQSLLTTPRGNIAVCRVLHRLLIPRHPPCALINLTTIISYLMSLEILMQYFRKNIATLNYII